MNYREWLLYRAQQCQTEPAEPQVLRYNTWQNYQLVQDWLRRSDAAQMLNFTRNEQPVGSSLA